MDRRRAGGVPMAGNGAVPNLSISVIPPTQMLPANPSSPLSPFAPVTTQSTSSGSSGVLGDIGPLVQIASLASKFLKAGGRISFQLPLRPWVRAFGESFGSPLLY